MTFQQNQSSLLGDGSRVLFKEIMLSMEEEQSRLTRLDSDWQIKKRPQEELKTCFMPDASLIITLLCARVHNPLKY